jgi:hypothetical protein
MLPQSVHSTCTSFGCVLISSLCSTSPPAGAQGNAHSWIELGYGGDGRNAGALLSFDAATEALCAELHFVLMATYCVSLPCRFGAHARH